MLQGSHQEPEISPQVRPLHRWGNRHKLGNLRGKPPRECKHHDLIWLHSIFFKLLISCYRIWMRTLTQRVRSLPVQRVYAREICRSWTRWCRPMSPCNSAGKSTTSGSTTTTSSYSSCETEPFNLALLSAVDVRHSLANDHFYVSLFQLFWN